MPRSHASGPQRSRSSARFHRRLNLHTPPSSVRPSPRRAVAGYRSIRSRATWATASASRSASRTRLPLAGMNMGDGWCSRARALERTVCARGAVSTSAHQRMIALVLCRIIGRSGRIALLTAAVTSRVAFTRPAEIAPQIPPTRPHRGAHRVAITDGNPHTRGCGLQAARRSSRAHSRSAAGSGWRTRGTPTGRRARRDRRGRPRTRWRTAPAAGDRRGDDMDRRARTSPRLVGLHRSSVTEKRAAGHCLPVSTRTSSDRERSHVQSPG